MKIDRYAWNGEGSCWKAMGRDGMGVKINNIHSINVWYSQRINNRFLKFDKKAQLLINV